MKICSFSREPFSRKPVHVVHAGSRPVNGGKRRFTSGKHQL